MITGTFLDEISLDIPSANWGPEEWTRDFAAMKADGIDTVVLRRAGFRDRATFDSEVLKRRHPRLIVQEDLVALFLGLAEQNGMSLWFGTYDSGEHGDPLSRSARGGARQGADLDRAFADEVWERYGRSRAFRGWYVNPTIDVLDERSMDACAGLSKHLRQLAALPILFAPGFRSSSEGARPFASVERELEQVFAHLRGVVDVLAIPDGVVPNAELCDYLALNVSLARSHGLACWSNVETFDRDVHIKYPPIAWPKLRFKMEAALAAKVDKLITFEYAHFLSPHSMFNSAHALHKRYREWLATQK